MKKGKLKRNILNCYDGMHFSEVQLQEVLDEAKADFPEKPLLQLTATYKGKEYNLTKNEIEVQALENEDFWHRSVWVWFEKWFGEVTTLTTKVEPKSSDQK